MKNSCGEIKINPNLECGYDLPAPFVSRIEIKEIDGKEVCTLFRPDGSALIENAKVTRLENGHIEIDNGSFVFEIIITTK